MSKRCPRGPWPSERVIARPFVFLWMLFAAAVSLLAVGSPTMAQDSGSPSSFAQGGLFGGGASLQPGLGSDEALTVSASFSVGSRRLSKAAEERRGELRVTADIAPGWHIYSLTQKPGGPIATTIRVEPSQTGAYKVVAGFQTGVEPTKQKLAAFGDLVVETHHGKLTWHAPLRIAATADLATLEIKGSLRAQPCTESSCLPPKNYPFVARLSPGGTIDSAVANANQSPLVEPVAQSRIATTSPAEGDKSAIGNVATDRTVSGKTAAEVTDTATAATVFLGDALKIEANDEIAKTPVAVIILMGFAGGFILNLMPCVLPVIGLKLLSFVEQSGQSRGRAFMLNFWYSLGLMSVFMVLATLAVGLGLGWGMLFQYSGFTITLTAVVFVMALSFFDVWEIPIPGFAGRGKTGEWSQREGAGGAFAKGVLTTFLATPCSAPLLAPALTWAATRSPAEVYMVFFFVGLGMATPYLIIGAFPRMIRFLPKPGEWMGTFKHVMGFVLLGTVVYLLTTLQLAHAVPTIALLFGLWGACWWVGRISPTADRQTKLRGWLQAAIFSCIIIIIAYPGIDEIAPRTINLFGKDIPTSFGGIYDVMNHRLERLVEKRLAEAGEEPQRVTSEEEIVWIPYTHKGLQSRLQRGETVLVDFTADWCATCKTLEAAVLDTPGIRKLLVDNKIATMQADMTHGDPQCTAMLDALGSKQVPVIAIFSADKPERPIVLRGGYTSDGLAAAIEEATKP